MNVNYVGNGKVVLIAGGGKIYTDVAARFVRSERSLEEIIASPYSKDIVQKIINSGHKAAVEFDFFIFGVEGYSRVTEVQLVRKRLASYMIKTGRAEKGGKRSFDVVLPKTIEKVQTRYALPIEKLYLSNGQPLQTVLPDEVSVFYALDSAEILSMIEQWYDEGVHSQVPEEDLRYLKPQATEFKALIGMNAHALLDWFSIRCCKNAQSEIRDLANKMLALCKQAAPDLFQNAGPSCRVLGYCPENDLQHPQCKGRVITKDKALEVIARSKWNSPEEQ